MKTLNRRRYFLGQAIVVGACALFGLALNAEASAVIFKQAVITVEPGKTFSVPVTIDPEGERQYTVRLSIVFPPELFEATSFAFSDNWIAVSQPGYDSVDNKLGGLVKTAGFPTGFVSPVLFGTVTFRSKATGDGAVALGPQSFILNAENESTLGSRPQVRVISSPAPIQTTPSSQPAQLAPPAEPALPLPDLPPEEVNIFDVSLTPAQDANGRGALFFISLVIAAVILGIVGRIVFMKLRHRSLVRKINHDKYINK